MFAVRLAVLGFPPTGRALGRLQTTYRSHREILPTPTVGASCPYSLGKASSSILQPPPAAPKCAAHDPPISTLLPFRGVTKAFTRRLPAPGSVTPRVCKVTACVDRGGVRLSCTRLCLPGGCRPPSRLRFWSGRLLVQGGRAVGLSSRGPCVLCAVPIRASPCAARAS